MFELTWAKNGTPDTLGSEQDTITISDQTSTTFNNIMGHMIGTGNVDSRIRLGNGSVDTGSNYADRGSGNGSVDFTFTTQDDIHLFNGDDDSFVISYIINIAGEEKLVISHICNNNTAGAATAPNRMEVVNKWTNTSNQFDNVQLLNVDTGGFLTSSNLSALGTD
jgi:hypothetical protein